MITPERQEIMQLRFVQLLGQYGIAPAAVYPVFDELVMAYSAPDRHYHNLEHLAEMFRVAGKLPTPNPRQVMLAIWFHDVVYDPRLADNEVSSARFAAERLRTLGVPTSDIDAVERLIEATTHQNSGDVDADTAVLLDADLAILGAAPDRYQRYAAAIRREYAYVPDEEYRIGRMRILERFLARERLYRTTTLFEVGESVARENLRNELAKWMSQ